MAIVVTNFVRVGSVRAATALDGPSAERAMDGVALGRRVLGTYASKRPTEQQRRWGVINGLYSVTFTVWPSECIYASRSVMSGVKVMVALWTNSPSRW